MSIPANEWTVVVQRPVPASVSWWVQPSREAFIERSKSELPRMLKMSGDPVVKSIRPMLLGGKLP